MLAEVPIRGRSIKNTRGFCSYEHFLNLSTKRYLMTTNAAAPAAATHVPMSIGLPSRAIADPDSIRNVSEIALEKLKQLIEFSGEMLTLDKTRDPALDVALTEIVPKIFHKKKLLTNHEVITLLRHCLALRTLNLSGFVRVSQDVLPQVANLKMLSTLNLSETAVTDLQPLIDNPLPQLTSVNLYQAKISREVLVEFMRKHKTIRTLTPPQNPPSGFFALIDIDLLESVKLIINSTAQGILDLPEIKDFFKRAPSLHNLCLTIDAKTNFNTNEWEPTKDRMPRHISMKARKLRIECDIEGKNKDSHLSKKDPLLV